MACCCIALNAAFADGTVMQLKTLLRVYSGLLLGRTVPAWLAPQPEVAQQVRQTIQDADRIRGLLVSNKPRAFCDGAMRVKQLAKALLAHLAHIQPKLAVSLRAGTAMLERGEQACVDKVAEQMHHVHTVMLAFQLSDVLLQTIRISNAKANEEVSCIPVDDLEPEQAAITHVCKLQALLKERQGVAVKDTHAQRCVQQLQICLIKLTVVYGRSVALHPKARAIAAHVMIGKHSPSVWALDSIIGEMETNLAFYQKHLDLVAPLLRGYADAVKAYNLVPPENLQRMLSRMACGVVKRKRQAVKQAPLRDQGIGISQGSNNCSSSTVLIDLCNAMQSQCSVDAHVSA